MYIYFALGVQVAAATEIKHFTFLKKIVYWMASGQYGFRKKKEKLDHSAGRFIWIPFREIKIAMPTRLATTMPDETFRALGINLESYIAVLPHRS